MKQGNLKSFFVLNAKNGQTCEVYAGATCTLKILNGMRFQLVSHLKGY